MKLLPKFSLIFVVVFGLGLGALAFICHSQFQKNARAEVLHQAHLMMDSAMAMRSYTSMRIKPLAAAKASSDIFHPETVPAFAATSLFEHLHSAYPEYSYREATLNPTNPRDRAHAWEADIINDFREQRDTNNVTFAGTRMTPSGESIYLASPIRATRSCLECHSTPEVAPPSMIKLYGSANGFGWKENEIIGAQIVSVPMTLAKSMADRSFHKLMVSLGIVGVLTLLALNVVLTVSVIRPVQRFAENADRISKGETGVPELPAKGKDEISVLAAAFNRMHRSLTAAMKMLEKK